MDTHVLVRGFIVGFALAAPIGPIGILVIRRSLEAGALAGLSSGLGAAVADAIFALAGALGLASLGSSATALRLAGGVFLVALGARSLFGRARARNGEAVSPVGHGRAFVTTLVFTLASPVSILSFAAVAASLGVARRGDALALVSGVFVGSLTWWALLCGGIGALRRHISDRAIAWANRAAGGALIVFGAFALVAR
jgi:threonine/homoserine/homoserine lactone efflux protein